MNQFAKKVRAILEKAGKIDSETGEALLSKSQEEKRPLTEIVVKDGVISEKELLCLIGKAANIPPLFVLSSSFRSRGAPSTNAAFPG